MTNPEIEREEDPEYFDQQVSSCYEALEKAFGELMKAQFCAQRLDFEEYNDIKSRITMLLIEKADKQEKDNDD